MNPVSSRCEIYEKLELACIHQQEIIVVLKSGTSHQGSAVDLQTRAGPKEFLLIDTQVTTSNEQSIVELCLEDTQSISWANNQEQANSLYFA
jgi:transcriptional antiterminator Rof (Rho-off)